MTITDIRASVLTAPTDATLIVDVHEAGVTLMATDKLDIEPEVYCICKEPR